MRPGTNIFLVILVLPPIAIFLYMYFIKYLSFSKSLVVWISLSFFSIVYLFMVYLNCLLPEDLTVLESFVYAALFFLIFFTLAFHGIEESFKKAYFYEKKPNPNINKDCSDFADYLINPKKTILVAYAYKFSMYGSGLSLGIIFICRKFYGISMNNEAYGWIYYVLCIFPALCLFCMAFLRLVVKCPNCECSLFPMTAEGDAFFTIPKRVIKDNAIDCMICSATYALDQSIDLEELRRDKKKRIEEGKFFSIGPDGRKRIGEINKK